MLDSAAMDRDALPCGWGKHMYRSGWQIMVGAGSLMAGAFVFAACGGGSAKSEPGASDIKNVNISAGAQGSPTPRPEAKIAISDNAFSPATLTVKAGTKVIWEWSGNNPHSVLLGGQDSGQKTGSGTYERSFDTPGSTINYQCGVHGAAMSGKIVVE